jgi:membrane associated rhomboid family serine protease
MKRAPLATLAIIAASVAAYRAELAGGGMAICERLGFVPAHPTVAAAVSYILVHDPDHVAHVAGNVLVLAILGAVVEPELGRGRLLALFVASGLAGALMHLIVVPGSEVPLVGMSGSLCGLMAIAAVLRPRVMLAFTAAYIGMNLVGLYITTPLVPAGTSVASHVGGFAAGVGCVLLARARGVRWVVA